MSSVKSPLPSRSKVSENSDPNLSTGNSPIMKSKNSPAVKSKKSVAKSLNQMVSPRNKIQERKFVVAKKNPKKVGLSAASTSSASSIITCKCKDKNENDNLKKCPCIAYQTLRASQEDFFKNRSNSNSVTDVQESEELKNCTEAQIEEEEEEMKLMKFINGNDQVGDEGKTLENGESCLNSPIIEESEEVKVSSEMGSSKIKRRRAKVLEEARSSVPEPGSGRVLHLVQAFEKLVTITKSKGSTEKEEGGEEEGEEGERGKEVIKKVSKWALPGMPPPEVPGRPKAPETENSSLSFSQPEMSFKPGCFEIGSSVSSSFDSSLGSFTSRTSAGGRRSRRNSSDSSGTSGMRRWKKKQQLRVTSQKPFKLRTEQRGRVKEEEFVKKVQEMFTEEEKMRIPIAQGLPWTTDEPEALVKPPVKESTRPVDLKLNSDVRAVERAEFDHHVAEKLSLIEQYRLERDRQQKMEEEEEIKRLRKELVPRAQPMPYFDRPFIPKRSEKHPTIPKEPKFHIPHHKKIKCMSWSDMDMYTQQQHH